MNPVKFHSLLLGLVGLLPAACDAVAPALRPVAASAQAWLHEQDGQTLVFENNRGQTQSLRVSQRATVAEDSRKCLQPAPVAHTYLGYRLAAMPDSGFSLKGVPDRASAFTDPAPRRTQRHSPLRQPVHI